MNIDLTQLKDTSPAALGVWAKCLLVSIGHECPGVLPLADCWLPETWAAHGLSAEEAASCGNLVRGPGKDWTVLGVVAQGAASAPAKPKAAHGKSEAQLRAEKLTKKRPTTPWDRSEQMAWKTASQVVEATSEEEWDVLEWFYKQPRTEDSYHRGALAQILNNWGGEISKAQAWRAKQTKSRGTSPRLTLLS